MEPPRPILTDFGLARDIATGSRYTRTGQALGTPAYMSPEQARGETSSLTPATDVWSLGCVLHELLAGGQRAFDGDTTAAVIGAILTGRRTRLSHVPAGPAGLVALLLEPRAARRPADAAAVRAACDHVLAGGRVRRRGVRVARVAAAAAAVGLGVLAVTWRPGAPAPPRPIAEPSRAVTLAARAEAVHPGSPQEAARLLEAALALEPARDDWRVRLGLCLWEAGEPAAARAAWSQVAPGSPSHGRARLHEALEAWFRMDATPEETIHASLRAAAADAGLVGRIARAATTLHAGRHEEAMAELTGCPGWEAALLRAEAAALSPAIDDAIALREYDAAAAEGIRFDWAALNRADILRKLGRPTEALAGFTAILERSPRDRLARLSRASLRARTGDRAGAESDFATLLEAAPDDGEVLATRAAAARRWGDPAGALRDAERAVACGVASPDERCNCAAELLEHGRAAAAEAVLDGILRDAPSHAAARLNRANARLMRGDVTAALEDLDRRLADGPDDPRIRYTRAQALIRLSRHAEALAALERLAAERFAHGRFRYWLAVALRECGRPDAAVAEMRAFLATADAADPYIPLAHRLLETTVPDDG